MTAPMLEYEWSRALTRDDGLGASTERVSVFEGNRPSARSSGKNVISGSTD
jgi:hypothetical protein